MGHEGRFGFTQGGHNLSDQVNFTAEELLASHKYEEPLVVTPLGDTLFHGGFDASGEYVSPRTLNRWPAINAWRAKHEAETGMPLISCPSDFFADFYPNVEQAKYLLSEGVRDPLIQMLTHIGTIEGFGSIIRFVEAGNLQRHFDESIDGTATAHLGLGLYEAHARDESGFELEGGHQQMWYGVRDLAFENPEVGDPLALVMKAFGNGDDAAGQAMQSMAKSMGGGDRVVPTIDESIETIILRMTGLLLIELLAANTFKWAEEVVSDDRYCANSAEASRLVDYIRRDEAPHVGYLEVTLTEMRARTFVGEGGVKTPGTKVIDDCWNYSLLQMFGLGGKRTANRDMFVGRMEELLQGHSRRNEIITNFHDLATPDPVIEQAAPTRAATAPSYS